MPRQAAEPGDVEDVPESTDRAPVGCQPTTDGTTRPGHCKRERNSGQDGRDDGSQGPTADLDVAGASPASPSPAPTKNPSRAEHDAIAALAEFGVNGAGKIMATYRPARIVQVCAAARAQAKRLKNPAAWIRTALSKGWAVEDQEPGKDR